MAKAGKEVWEIIEACPSVLRTPSLIERLPQMIAQMEAAKHPKDLSDKKDNKVVIYWGPSGCGKSRKARWEIDMLCLEKNLRYYLVHMENGLPLFNGYNGEAILYMDEVIPGELTDISNLFKILDAYWQVKGRQKGAPPVPLSHTHVWMTSMTDPREWYIIL